MTKKIRLLPAETGEDELMALPAPDAPEYIPFIQMSNARTRALGRPRWMLHRHTLFGSVLTVHEDGPSTGLPEWHFSGFFKQDENKKLPAELLAQAHGFFKWALETLHTEAVVLITADWDDNLALFCPDQQNSYAGVSYNFDVDTLPAGHAVVGSIHSHCDFSAFHSGTDTHDADKTDGLHITLGFVDKDIAEADVMFAFSKVKWQGWDISLVLDGPQLPAGEFDDEWKKHITTEVIRPKMLPAPTVNWTTGWEFDNDLEYMRWLRDDEDDSKKHTKKQDHPSNHRANMLKRFVMRGTDYMYGDQKRAIKTLETDLMILADIVKDGGIELTFDVKSTISVADLKGRPLAD